MTDAAKPKRKRGRPSKAEIAAREAAIEPKQAEPLKPSKYVFVPTVPHSGSKFVARHLFRNWRLTNPRRDSEPGCHFDHTWPHSLDLFEKIWDQGPIVVPVRRPEAVVMSWQRRHKPLDDLMFLFDNLIERVVPMSPYFIPVDAPDRDKYLEALNRGAGFELSTSWPKVGSVAKPDVPLNKKFTDALIAKHGDFFARFYDLSR